MATGKTSNYGMIGTSSDLGLGNQLAAQTKEEIERRKKLQQLGLSGTPSSLAVQSLFGSAGGRGGY